MPCRRPRREGIGSSPVDVRWSGGPRQLIAQRSRLGPRVADLSRRCRQSWIMMTWRAGLIDSAVDDQSHLSQRAFSDLSEAPPEHIMKSKRVGDPPGSASSDDASPRDSAGRKRRPPPSKPSSSGRVVAELRESQRRLQSILDNVKLIAITLDCRRGSPSQTISSCR